MYKRTLYIDELSQNQIDQLARSQNKSKAEILRQAVEEGLKHMTIPISVQTQKNNPIIQPNPSILTSHIDSNKDDLLTRFFRLIIK